VVRQKKAKKRTDMYKEKYYELIDQVCEKLGISDPEPMHNACDIRVSDIPFTLLHGGEVDEDSLYIYCNFGEPPAERKAVMLRLLMQTNLSIFGNNSLNLGVNTHTGRTLQMSRMAISQTTIESLMSVLVSVAAYAHMWRRSYLLSDAEFEQMAAHQSGSKIAA
jgi:hypothetical protein